MRAVTGQTRRSGQETAAMAGSLPVITSVQRVEEMLAQAVNCAMTVTYTLQTAPELRVVNYILWPGVQVVPETPNIARNIDREKQNLP